MSYRMTQTDLWLQAWFTKLPPAFKAFWFYINAHCDAAGVWAVNMELATFNVGTELDERAALKAFGTQVKDLGDGRWLLTHFIELQTCGRGLSLRSPPHIAIRRLLQSHGLPVPEVEEPY